MATYSPFITPKSHHPPGESDPHGNGSVLQESAWQHVVWVSAAKVDSYRRGARVAFHAPPCGNFMGVKHLTVSALSPSLNHQDPLAGQMAETTSYLPD